MAKRNTSKRKSSKKNNGPDPLGWLIGGIAKLFADQESRENTRRVAGWSFIFIFVLSLIACISFFTSGPADATLVEDGTGSAQNWLGKFGAYIANILVYKGFGIFGILWAAYGIFIGFVLLEDDFYVLMRRLFKYVAFISIWGSMFFAFIIDLMNAGEAVAKNHEIAGGLGFMLNAYVYTFLGTLGTAFFLLFSLLIFIVINFKTEIRASRMLQNLTERINAKDAGPIAKVKDRFNKALTKAKAENRPDPAVKKAAKTAEKAPAVVTEEVKTEAGQQISMDVGPKVIQPKKTKAKAPLTSPESLEMEINIPEEEEKVAASVVKPEQKELQQLGEDNVGKVIGEEGNFEKIVAPEDQETDLTEEVIDWEEFDPTKELSDYNPPVLELLEDHGSGSLEVNRSELEENKNKIVETLSNYGIGITEIKATIGPTVTLYEIVPAPGVRISKIRNLEDDIALNLAALGIRIIAPIPGQGTIGIEVPNSNSETVSLRGILSSVKFQTTKYALPIAIGKTISNQVFISDLNRMPHLLIAGATGQGKSVGLNTIIASILYKKHPSEVKFVLIDPKKVEMTLYQSLANHFLATLPNLSEPIITEVRDAVLVLKSLCIEMDERYELLKMARVRNLQEYNTKFTNRKLNPRKGHKYLPYIVLVIDELADMMMVAGKEVEMPIARLAQLARAVGIHLVVATQRPSVNVITGIIKANFPARMSYRVISKVDSRTILDANGADQLVGRGDLLLSTGSDLIRIQNAFIDTPEVERLVDYIAAQRGFPEPYYLPDIPTEGDLDEDNEPFEKDSNFEEAARLVVRYQIGSASLIQRKLKLGYNRAGRIIDQLERANIVGPHSGSKARDVLITDEAELERYLENLS